MPRVIKGAINRSIRKLVGLNLMSHIILSNVVAGISELKINPMATMRSAMGEPVAILNRNEPVFYCVPAPLYEAMLDLIEDIELAKIVQSRSHEKEIKVTINDL